MMDYLRPIGLLLISNIFMTYAWYGHIKDLRAKPMWMAIVLSWGVAFFEYCFQVPANRLGSDVYTLGQLKIIQEVITMLVFVGFSIWYMGTPVTRNFLYAGICLVGAVYFIFNDGAPVAS